MAPRGRAGDSQLVLFATWLETGPDVPDGKWFKRYPEMTVCDEG